MKLPMLVISSVAFDFKSALQHESSLYTVTKYYGHDVNALNKHCKSLSSSTTTMVYSDVNIPSSLNDFDMVDYVIDDKNIGLTINEDKEKMMDDLMWGHVYETKHATTHIRDNKVKESIHVEFQDVVVHGIRVNTIVNSSFSVTKGIEIDAFKAQVEDVKIEDYQVDESEVDEVVVKSATVGKPASIGRIQKETSLTSFRSALACSHYREVHMLDNIGKSELDSYYLSD
ncbi:hypothetical protein Tco_1507284 [Tanacetum coccineum]